MASAISVQKVQSGTEKIDLTPMLDVVFILLIFFVVTAVFLKESALAVNGQNAQEQSQLTEEMQNISIQITQAGRVYFNGREVELSAVQARVAQVRAENPSASVIIKPAFDSQARTLVSVIDAAKRAGASEVAVLE